MWDYFPEHKAKRKTGRVTGADRSAELRAYIQAQNSGSVK